jgi:hypothetical protein
MLALLIWNAIKLISPAEVSAGSKPAYWFVTAEKGGAVNDGLKATAEGGAKRH